MYCTSQHHRRAIYVRAQQQRIFNLILRPFFYLCFFCLGGFPAASLHRAANNLMTSATTKMYPFFIGATCWILVSLSNFKSPSLHDL
mmetsp:Transcript_24746/g.40827  ORF Transcript_24746/g.40827 Transcript_24746/m.40827 type:complete len:87 (+) Transcript_24746:17-277(+)